jgi:hypothetical protein
MRKCQSVVLLPEGTGAGSVARIKREDARAEHIAHNGVIEKLTPR